MNVVVRSHELPFFSRLGAFDRSLPARLVERGELFEYWGHEASLLPVELQPLLRWRMARAEAGEMWSGLARLAREQPAYVEAVFEEAAARGPIAASELADPGGRTGPWWGWNKGKQALEYLFWCGRLAARRRANFERVYGLPARLLPAEVLAAPTPDVADAQRELLARSALAHGVGSARCLADYYRLKPAEARPRLAELVEDGRLLTAEVDGWSEPTYLHPDVARPRRLRARALLAPFDPLVWERRRIEALFGFHYRLEFYVPEPKRTYGYYVAPFLLGDRLVARVDLKADRASSTLRVRGAYAEPGQATAEVASELGEELELLAGWLELEAVRIEPRGDLAPLLAP